jgi:hypothetical protein
MDANELTKRLIAYAEDDIAVVEETGTYTIVGSKKGTVVLEYAANVYTITALGSINFVTAERAKELLYQGPKEGAVLVLSGLYTVEGE